MSGRLDVLQLPEDRPPVATRLNRQLPRQDFHLQERATFARRTLTLAAALPLVFLLGVAEMPIQAVFAAYPDWGLATILLSMLLVPTAVWRNLVRSEEWRAHG